MVKIKILSILIVILLLLSCVSYTNLYNDDLSKKRVFISSDDLEKIDLNGYYYRIYKTENDKPSILILIFFKDGKMIRYRHYLCCDLNMLDQFLLSERFREILIHNSSTLVGKYKIKINELITQMKYGNFMSMGPNIIITNIYEIEDEKTLNLVKIYKQELYDVDSENYKFREFTKVVNLRKEVNDISKN